MKYPKECPLFEVTIDNGNYVARGGIVEGVEIGFNGMGQEEVGFVGCRIIDEPDPFVLWYPKKSEQHGYRGIMARVSDIKPLTSTAVEMLAIAKAAAK